MDKTIIQYLINIIVLVPIGVLLMVIAIKLSKKSMHNINSDLYIQVLERFNLSKDLSIYLIKTGSTGYVLVASLHNIEKIKELDEEKMNEIIAMKKEKQSSIDLSKIAGIDFKDILNKKLMGKKDDGFNK